MLKYGSDYGARVFCVTPTDSHEQSPYREEGARRGVHFNPKCPHSVLPTVDRGLKSEPKNKDTSTVYA